MTELALIRAAFSAAAESYDQAARVQRRIIAQLAGLTPHSCRGLLLDAGSGTGQAASVLRSHHPEARLLPLDAAIGMCHRTGGICGDIEALPLSDGSVALYWSSLAWQWTDASRALQEAARVLAPGGLLQVATLGPDTLWELRQAFRGIDGHTHVRNFTLADELQQAATAAGFIDIQVKCETECTHTPDLAGLLRELRAIGAHSLDAPRRRGLLSRSAWLAFQAAYEPHRESAGLRASYDVIYLLARRP
ncbi:MAG: malonyl-[acyl-carrier protein] O-methyltransferase BioC [Candidatus Dactylopiibacterium carminicum]|uniref:Malonyl-[acyl-carrier protein] O-methyltransferase BioC n=1 Tax=Candidatus Dactylopiibacterium carminicum TaxID=857335 RepID=A0A272ETY8_9RHOO|nr:methyltransferase domain-containing protein [Candidatus Dactylopiibacterium carminicum]KAF7599648.1 methyltransferase domain-containing protein [Candidatus Dactylopiibacterium carminicum]PAS93574.1 MAG: malonyl-[acyl-carrier protein] O-methyltransferase BioC [Candidatus Dactylopiibacterium carminicum]PAS99649.1 MAG: hypothetical protein BSR46_06675 [Candidatus Dactylopiibacterium carminicum]